MTPEQLSAALVAAAPAGLKVSRFPWLLVTLMGLASPVMREVGKMGYLWQIPDGTPGRPPRRHPRPRLRHALRRSRGGNGRAVLRQGGEGGLISERGASSPSPRTLIHAVAPRLCSRRSLPRAAGRGGTTRPKPSDVIRGVVGGGPHPPKLPSSPRVPAPSPTLPTQAGGCPLVEAPLSRDHRRCRLVGDAPSGRAAVLTMVVEPSALVVTVCVTT